MTMHTICKHSHETSKVWKSATANSCFDLIGPPQCSAALDGSATLKENLRHQGALNKPESPKPLMGFVKALKTSLINQKLAIVKAQ